MCAARCGAYGDVLTSPLGSPRLSAPHSVAFVPYPDISTPYSVTFFSYSDKFLPLQSPARGCPSLGCFPSGSSNARSPSCGGVWTLFMASPCGSLSPLLSAVSPPCRACPRLRQMLQAQNRRVFQRWFSQPRQQVRRRWCFWVMAGAAPPMGSLPPHACVSTPEGSISLIFCWNTQSCQ